MKLVRRAVALAVVLLIGVVSLLLRRVDEPDRSIHPSLIRKALDWIEPEKKTIFTSSAITGIIVCPTPPPAPPSNPPSPPPSATP